MDSELTSSPPPHPTHTNSPLRMWRTWISPWVAQFDTYDFPLHTMESGLWEAEDPWPIYTHPSTPLYKWKQQQSRACLDKSQSSSQCKITHNYSYLEKEVLLKILSYKAISAGFLRIGVIRHSWNEGKSGEEISNGQCLFQRWALDKISPCDHESHRGNEHQDASHLTFRVGLRLSCQLLELVNCPSGAPLGWLLLLK